MGQFNMNTTSEFERSLARLMEVRGLPNKAAAIRVAVEEALERAVQGTGRRDFSDWRGAGRRAPENPSPRFPTDDDLWGAG